MPDIEFKLGASTMNLSLPVGVNSDITSVIEMCNQLSELCYAELDAKSWQSSIYKFNQAGLTRELHLPLVAVNYINYATAIGTSSVDTLDNIYWPVDLSELVQLQTIDKLAEFSVDHNLFLKHFTLLCLQYYLPTVLGYSPFLITSPNIFFSKGANEANVENPLTNSNISLMLDNQCAQIFTVVENGSKELVLVTANSLPILSQLNWHIHNKQALIPLLQTLQLPAWKLTATGDVEEITF
jgi:hypothetical protein